MKGYGPDRWLMDTGSGHDLISNPDIPDWNRENMMEMCPRLAELHTANGVTLVMNQVSMQIVGLKDDATALVLASTPAMLSIGARCMEKGWKFEWMAGKEPTMTSPFGSMIRLRVIGNVPFRAGPSESCRPATSHEYGPCAV